MKHALLYCILLRSQSHEELPRGLDGELTISLGIEFDYRPLEAYILIFLQAWVVATSSSRPLALKNRERPKFDEFCLAHCWTLIVTKGKLLTV